MAAPRLVSDEALIEAYRRLGNVHKVGVELGIRGASVHERLVRLGINQSINVWKPEEDAILRAEYESYAATGRLTELAKRLGRNRHTICRRARHLGLTKRQRLRPYISTWKYVNEHEALLWFEEFKKTKATLSVAAWCKSRKVDVLGFSRTMQKYFPDEWDLFLEASAPRQGFYRLGRSFEYQVRNYLRKHKYFVLRSPASKSPLDLVAVKKGDPLLFIQCKRSGQIGVAEWNELYDLADACGASALLAERDGHKAIRLSRLIGRKDGSRRAQPMNPWQPAPSAPLFDRRDP